MENINNYLQLGATFILAMGLLRLIEVLIVKYTGRNGDGPEGYAKKILSELQISNNNHLSHIYEALKENAMHEEGWQQKVINKSDRQIELLVEVVTLLKNK